MTHSTAQADGDDGGPWGPHIDATHLTGDLWYIRKRDPSWWTLAGVLCFVLPPVGVAMVAYMAVDGIHSADDPVPVELAE